MTLWKVGTVGFGYDEWVGNFYPPGLKSAEYLPFYSRYFDSAEIDATFYGMPAAETVERWAGVTPPTFVFCPKTPRQITHDGLLVHGIRPMREFVQRMQTLGPKLGPVLIQFPPSFTLDELDTQLKPFLGALPDGTRYAVEFRDLSWRRGRVLELLRDHRIAWVSADYIHMPPEIHPTTDFLYLRFIGAHGQFAEKDVERIDQTPRLQAWLDKMAPHLPDTKVVYAFFNNDYSGHSPATCNRLKTLIGLDPDYPVHPFQPSLF